MEKQTTECKQILFACALVNGAYLRRTQVLLMLQMKTRSFAKTGGDFRMITSSFHGNKMLTNR